MRAILTLLFLVSSWKPIDQAPHEQIIEICSTWGIAPSYGLFIWSEERGGIWIDAIELAKESHLYYARDAFSRLKWRPYHGSLRAYVDPTHGAQKERWYWIQATANPNYTCKE